ncbi:MAG: hypothetical protein V1866_03100 [archaeon]
MKLSSNRRGAEMAMSTIVVIVLVLIVLVVLLYIFGKSSGGFISGVTSCEDRGGSCQGSAESCISSGGSVYRIGSCKEKDSVCCLPEKSSSQDN